MGRTILTLVVLSLTSLRLPAQRIVGEITGTIVDASGAAVSGAKVTAADRATQRSWVAEANADGIYRLSSLAPGTSYDIRIEQPGFRTMVHENVALDVGQV